MKKLILIVLILATGCAGPKFRASCVIPQTEIVVFSSQYHAGIASKGLITVSGEKRRDGVIYPHMEVLGHEALHLLNIYCPGIYNNPDKP
jgi:hypothetical protein